MQSQKYLIVIEKADGNYSAFSPDVSGCVATGDTIEDSIANMKDALEFHIEALDETPEAKGLKYHIENGIFEDGEIDERYFITLLEIQVPEAA